VRRSHFLEVPWSAIDELNSGAVISVMGKSLVAQNATLVQAFHYLAVALVAQASPCHLDF
jgi:hypothetical protein